MTFENQIWLTLTPLIVLLFAGLFAFGLRRREALLSRFAATRLLDQLTEKASHQRTLLKAGLILLALMLIGLALARPQYGVDWIERKARGLDIVFVLDSSKSMLATDLRPTRLDRAKLAIIDLVKRLESDRIGLVVFAGNAFLQTPPTLDYAAFRENLDSIGHSSLSRGGSDIGRAINEAAKAFPKDNNFKVVILLTDGEDQQEQAIDAARAVAKDGIKIYSIGIGTPEGEYLKIRNAQGDEEFIRDSSGQPVRSQLDETTLQEIAQLTGGSYSRLSDQSLNTLYNSVLATLPREERESELQEARIERYQWALSAACLFLVLEIFIRRRSKASIQVALIIAASSLLIPTHSEAQELVPQDITEPPLPATEAPEPISHDPETDPRVLYNQAHEQLIAGSFPEATRLYEEAIERSEDRQLERDALYNMGHATNQIGEAALQAQDFEAAIESWKQAEALFKSANEIDPNDTTTIEDLTAIEARRKALEAFLQQQEPQDQENSDDSDQEQEESEEGEEGEENQESSEDGEPGEESEEGEQSEDQQSGEEGEESEQGQDGEESSEQSDSESESSEGEESEEPSEGESTESTGDPAEDMEQQAQQDAAAEGEESEQETSEEQTEAVQPTEGEEGVEGEPGEMMIQGMSISEAQDLLDSLRGDERLLPFSEPTDEQRRSDRTREIRDW